MLNYATSEFPRYLEHRPRRPLRDYLLSLDQFAYDLFAKLSNYRARDDLYDDAGQRKIVDPKLGLGLSAPEIREAGWAARKLITGSN